MKITIDWFGNMIIEELHHIEKIVFLVTFQPFGYWPKIVLPDCHKYSGSYVRA